MILSVPWLIGCRPLVIGDGLVAVGCFDYRRTNVTDHSHLTEIAGLGLVMDTGRVMVGYTKVNRLCCGAEERHLATRVGSAEILIGEPAEREAARGAAALFGRNFKINGSDDT